MNILKPVLFFLASTLLWGVLTVYLSLQGLWLSPIVSAGNHDGFYQWAVNELTTKNQGNSALILLQDGKVSKQHFSQGSEPIDGDTLFATASFSKWITALGVMGLVEDGSVDLDAPVSSYLTRWQLPESAFNDQVTVRRLLSHTAGLTDGLGFGDYQLDEELQSLEEELSQPRSSSGTETVIAVGVEPGSEFIYSGGGYLMLELLVEEVSGVEFKEYIQTRLFDPLAMERSTYLANPLENVSSSYYQDGTVAPTYKYASAAATGLTSTPNDLAKLGQAALSSDQDIPVSAATAAAMREPHGFVLGAGIWGLGTMLYAPASEAEFVFGHDGGNDPAINSSVRLNPLTSDGIILLVSGHPSLATNIGSEWVLWQTGYPDFLQTERALESAGVPFLIGSFLLALATIIWSRRQESES